MGDSRETSSRSARQRDVILARPNQGCQRLTQTSGNEEKRLIIDDVWPLLRRYERLYALSATQGIAACAAKFKYVASSIGNHSFFQSLDCIVIICSQANCPADLGQTTPCQLSVDRRTPHQGTPPQRRASAQTRATLKRMACVLQLALRLHRSLLSREQCRRDIPLSGIADNDNDQLPGAIRSRGQRQCCMQRRT